MEDLGLLIGVIVDIMSIPFTIWGVTLNFWDIMLSLLIGSLVIYFIGRFFNG